METIKWVCSNNSGHVFEHASADYVCSKCKRLGQLGFLTEKKTVVLPDTTQTTLPTQTTHPITENPNPEIIETLLPKFIYDPPSLNPNRRKKEVGLCVLVMDASGSMLEPAFEGNPLSRLKLIAKTAAYGVFDLQRMQNNPNAFVSILMFDDRVKMVFPERVISISELIRRFEANVDQFALFLEEELGKMKQGTDINSALNAAHDLVSEFMKLELPEIFNKTYSPIIQTILKHGTVDSVSIPNVRVLIYTDGMQFDGQQNRDLLPNPFIARPISGINHDILIGAYFGEGVDEGAEQLRYLVSQCPVHNEPQFFLIDSLVKIKSLQTLFRMASGASGFCPKCLEAFINY